MTKPNFLDHAKELVGLSTDLFCVINRNGYLVDFSENWVKTLGWSHSELVTKPILAFVSTGDQEKTKTALAHLLKAKKIIQFENRMVKKDGEGCPFNWRIYYETKKELFYAIAEDLTENRQMMNLLRITQEAACIGEWKIELESKVCHWPELACRIFELPPGKKFFIDELTSYFVEDYRAVFQACVNTAVRERKEWDVELKVIISEEREKWIRMMGKPVFSGEGGFRLEGIVQDIDQRKTFEEELYRKSRFLEKVVANVPSMIFVKDPRKDFRFSLLNAAGEKILGVKEAEFLGKTDFDIFPPEQAEVIIENDWNMFAFSKGIEVVEETFETPRGTRVLRTMKVPVFDQEGNPEYLIGISDDITEVQAIQKEKENQNMLLEIIFQSFPDALLLTDPEGLIMRISNGFERLFGYKENEIKGESTTVIYPGTESLFDKAKSRYFSDPLLDYLPFEEEYVTKSGKQFTGETVGSIIKTQSGELLGYLGSIRDVTEERKIKFQITESERNLRQAQRAAKIGSWRLDLSTRKFTWTDQMYEMFSLDSVLGEPDFEKHFDSLAPQDKFLWRLALEKCSEDGVPFSIRFRTTGNKGELIWVEAHGEGATDRSGKFDAINGTCQNISEKVFHEQELEQERGKLLQASKMSSLGEMAGGIAHEINNPLAIISGRASQLKRMTEGDLKAEAVLLCAEKIEATTMRISKIIKGLRAFSRNAEHDPMVPTRIRTVIEDILELSVQGFRISGIELKVIGDQELEVMCRPPQVGQVLLNLLNNSRDAVMGQAGAWVELAVKAEDPKMILSVTDSGSGIPPEVAARIMEPFFTTKETGKGTGLGLSITKGIIEDHGGKFYLDTNSSNTRFVIEIPLRPAVQTPVSGGEAA